MNKALSFRLKMTPTKWAALSLLTTSLMLLAIFHCCGLYLIEEAYFERSVSFLNDVLEGRANHSLESYEARASGLVHVTAALLLVLSCALYFWNFFTENFLVVHERFRRKTSNVSLLVTLLMGDAILTILHITHVQLGIPNSRMFAIDVDGGLPEIYQYGKEFFCALWLFAIAKRQKSSICLAWAALFVYFLIDDSAQFHERAGALVANAAGFIPMAGFRPQDLGELAVTAVFGTAFLFFIARAHFASGRWERALSFVLFFSVAAFGFFGVVTDMAHVLLPQRQYYFTLVLIEDAGEMVVMSFIAWLVTSIRIFPKRGN